MQSDWAEDSSERPGAVGGSGLGRLLEEREGTRREVLLARQAYILNCSRRWRRMKTQCWVLGLTPSPHPPLIS